MAKVSLKLKDTINNELVNTTSYYNITTHTVCSQGLMNRNIKKLGE